LRGSALWRRSVRLIEQQGRDLVGALRPACASSPSPRARKRQKARPRSARHRLGQDPLALANDPGIDCFVELMGGAGDPALSAIEAALKSGKSVVTANKALIAKHGQRLAKLAEKHGCALNFEAAVGAAIPRRQDLREGLAGTKSTASTAFSTAPAITS
jgi:homoserine dehydrogenase